MIQIFEGFPQPCLDTDQTRSTNKTVTMRLRF